MVNSERNTVRQAEELLRQLFLEFAGLSVWIPHESPSDPGHDVVIEAVGPETTWRIVVEAKSRVTPQTAIALCERMQTHSDEFIPVIFAPVISPRVAEIAKAYGVGYVDGAGNCFLRGRRPPLLIERTGFKSPYPAPKRVIDPFSPKSSRIVRAMLSEPGKGWKVREFAENPEINVSTGLASKVKQALVEEGYVVERNRLLYLRDAIGLLNAWSQSYPGPAEEIPMYFRGDTGTAERTISRWCQDNALHYALAGYSAAWRLAAEVRYSVGAFYVEDRGFDRTLLEQLAVKYGGKGVDSGPNLFLWRPFDRSVLAGRMQASFDSSSPSRQVVAGQPTPWVTSPLQTWLDLKRSAGRGEEAANAVFEKHLSHDLHAAVKRDEEWQHGAV